MPKSKANIANSNLTFPSQECYNDRILRARRAMKHARIEVLLLSGTDHHRFFSGLNGLPTGHPIWLVILNNRAPSFVAPRSEAKEIQNRCDICVAAEWIEWEEGTLGPMAHEEALVQYLGEIVPDAGSIGIDFDATSALNVELVKTALGAERIKDATNLLHELFIIKDLVAIDLIQRSTDIAEHQFIACKNVIAPGVPKWSVALASFNAATERSAQWWNGDEEQSPFVQGMLMMGGGPRRTARCHSAGGGRILEDGDLLEVCFCGPLFFGHAIGFDRPFLVGSKPLPASICKIVNIARAAQEAALACICPGVTAGKVDAAATAAIMSGPWSNPILHRTGRFIGYSDFDGYELNTGSSIILQPGMVMTVEPGIYVHGIGGARFGDTIVVTSEGYETLTPFHLGRDI